jgi:hypothetical protein
MVWGRVTVAATTAATRSQLVTRSSYQHASDAACDLLLLSMPWSKVQNTIRQGHNLVHNKSRGCGGCGWAATTLMLACIYH